jgi:tRNA pseudouridine32 synthase/23S rRNA pseudouridine746 synthase
LSKLNAKERAAVESENNAMQLAIIFKNQHFVVIDKPTGILSVPSRTGRSDPRPVAGILLQDQLGSQIYPVHRLDEDTSGLLMFAMSQEASRAGNLWFESHEIIKTYEALSIPLTLEDFQRWSTENTWEIKLMRGKRRAYEANYGKESITKARCVSASSANKSVWHLKPITGRSHQLRYEMARHGFPIAGDFLYGSAQKADHDRGIDLRAFKLDLTQCRSRSDFNLPEVIGIGGLRNIP